MLPHHKVYGVNFVVQLLSEPPSGLTIHCPRGSAMRYGRVVAAGDGFDAGANTFREMPDVGTLVAFEESPEGVEGHYFYLGTDEYRVLHLDAVIIAFPQE
ncbi:MAG: hypothetical protein ACE5IQ_08295 [Candidatus Methylomirabilales bacterium]